jgi:hypothetical protein
MAPGVRPARRVARWPTLPSWAICIAGAILFGGCALPAALVRSAPPADALYVASALDGTLTRLEATSGRTQAVPLPAGPSPTQVALGANEEVLTLSGDPALGSILTYTTRVRDGNGAGLVEQPIPLEPGARAVLLAGDGERYAVVISLLALPLADDGAGESRRSGAVCRLALVDLRSGTVEAIHTVCAPGDLPTGLAMETTAAGPIAYVAVWSRAAQVGANLRLAGARVVAVQARTGRMLAALPLAGLPRPISSGGSLILAAGRNGAGRRLYCVEALPGSDLATWSAQEYEWQAAMSGSWQIRELALDPLTAERAVPLAFAPAGLTVTRDGAQAYAFNARDDSLMQIDLASGHATGLAKVNGYSAYGLATTEDRVYVANPPADLVWVFDRQRGRRVQVIPAGRKPVWIGVAAGNGSRQAIEQPT